MKQWVVLVLCLVCSSGYSAEKSTNPAIAANGTPPSPSTPVSAPLNAEQSAEQRQQQVLIANAERLDNLNRELLTQNQSLQLYNEKLAQQVELLKHDRSAEGMRNGALAVIVGVLLGWLLASNKRRHDKW
ncbi:hypothetical protein [Agitococcus lubricus]|uniref:SH3 domain protein n=1 Tax=Agitococcus lubricus TaxID=1077255 RepID=A0A2T5IZS4_9GAMM|nr:hypothetical protein [Agitococcus lubricus]PTQ89570.1 hypothetical protein C8N29_106101 [Agitococcus lubricus]